MIYRKYATPPIVQMLAITGIGLFLAGCNQANSEETDKAVKSVKLVKVPDVTTQQYDSFIAEVDATERAILSFQVSGEIEQMKLKMGQQVKKGDLLSQLDPTDYQLAVDAKNAEYELAKTGYERARALYIKKLISTDVFDQRETEYKASKAALDQAETDLAYTQIRAPFDGVVSLSYVKEHQVVAVNQPVLNLINNAVMDVVFNLPVSYIEQHGLDCVSKSSLSVTMDIHKQVRIPALFKEISTKADSEINSYRASVIIQRPVNQNLFSGMTGQVHFPKQRNDIAFDVVETAWIHKWETSGTLFRLDPNSQTLKTIEVDLNSQGQIIGGIRSGDLIVEAGVSQLHEGQHVKAWLKEGGI